MQYQFEPQEVPVRKRAATKSATSVNHIEKQPPLQCSAQLRMPITTLRLNKKEEKNKHHDVGQR